MHLNRTQLFFAITGIMVAFNGLYCFCERNPFVNIFEKGGKSVTAFLPSPVASLISLVIVQLRECGISAISPLFAVI